MQLIEHAMEDMHGIEFSAESPVYSSGSFGGGKLSGGELCRSV